VEPGADVASAPADSGALRPDAAASAHPVDGSVAPSPPGADASADDSVVATAGCSCTSTRGDAPTAATLAIVAMVVAGRRRKQLPR
jgi:MYXO-CTERM domain-containing protein